MSHTVEQRSDRRLCLSIFALLLASYAFFYQGGGWNENSRMDLVRALVEDRTFSIDRFNTNTGDKAWFDGHYYSDKAPGVSLLGSVPYLVVLPFRGFFATEHDFVVFASYIVTIAVVSLSTAILGALVYRVARKLGAGQPAAAITAVAYGLGTIAFPLSTMFFSHQVAALLLFSAFYLAMLCKERPSRMRSAGVALCGAAAVVVEFPSLIALPIIAGYHYSEVFRGRGGKSLPRLLPFVIGLAVPGLLLGGYLWSSFGSPISVGYDLLADEASRTEMRSHGLFGLTYPKISVIFELLIGRRRGLIPYSPILLLAAFGLVKRSHRPERLVVLALVTVYLLFVSSYEWWHGGASFGSRHLAPVLPFWMLPFAWVAEARPRLSLLAIAVSMGFMTVVTAVQPKVSETYEDPFWGPILNAFSQGHIPANHVCPYTGLRDGPDHESFIRGTRHDAFNLGVVLGGKGQKTLIPLLALWGASAWALRQTLRQRRVAVATAGAPEGHAAAAEPGGDP